MIAGGGSHVDTAPLAALQVPSYGRGKTALFCRLNPPIVDTARHDRRVVHVLGAPINLEKFDTEDAYERCRQFAIVVSFALDLWSPAESRFVG